MNNAEASSSSEDEDDDDVAMQDLATAVLESEVTLRRCVRGWASTQLCSVNRESWRSLRGGVRH